MNELLKVYVQNVQKIPIAQLVKLDGNLLKTYYRSNADYVKKMINSRFHISFSYVEIFYKFLDETFIHENMSSLLPYYHDVNSDIQNAMKSDLSKLINKNDTKTEYFANEFLEMLENNGVEYIVNNLIRDNITAKRIQFLIYIISGSLRKYPLLFRKHIQILNNKDITKIIKINIKNAEELNNLFYLFIEEIGINKFVSLIIDNPELIKFYVMRHSSIPYEVLEKLDDNLLKIYYDNHKHNVAILLKNDFNNNFRLFSKFMDKDDLISLFNIISNNNQSNTLLSYSYDEMKIVLNEIGYENFTENIFNLQNGVNVDKNAKRMEFLFMLPKIKSKNADWFVSFYTNYFDIITQKDISEITYGYYMHNNHLIFREFLKNTPIQIYEKNPEAFQVVLEDAQRGDNDVILYIPKKIIEKYFNIKEYDIKVKKISDKIYDTYYSTLNVDSKDSMMEILKNDRWTNFLNYDGKYDLPQEPIDDVAEGIWKKIEKNR